MKLFLKETIPWFKEL